MSAQAGNQAKSSGVPSPSNSASKARTSAGVARSQGVDGRVAQNHVSAVLKEVELHGRDRNDCRREPPGRMRLKSLSLNEPGIRTIMPSPGGWKLHIWACLTLSP